VWHYILYIMWHYALVIDQLINIITMVSLTVAYFKF